MSVLRTSIDSARAELAANPKLRLGVWSIVAILLGYWVFVPQAARVEQAAADYAAMDGRLARARELLAREDWQQRLDEARTTRAALVERIWHADNEGLAQAHVRTVIEEAARRVNFRPTVGVGFGRSVPGVPGLWQVDVNVTGRSGLESALRFVHGVASHPRVLVADRFALSLRGLARRRDEVVMDGMFTAYFRLGSPEEAEAPNATTGLPLQTGVDDADA